MDLHILSDLSKNNKPIIMKRKTKLIILPLFIAIAISFKLLLKEGYVLIDGEFMNLMAGFFIGVGLGLLIELVFGKSNKKKEAHAD